MAVAALASLAVADEPRDPAFTPSPEFQQLLTTVVREALPERYEKKKNWGHTTRVFDGWNVEQDGLKIETRRRWKQANDGTWQKYDVRLMDAADAFRLRVDHVEQQANKVCLDLTVDAALDVSGRQAQWERGVQLYSVGVEADARVQLTAHLEIAARLDPTKLPPDVSLQPVVTTADLKISEFKLRRISEFDGPIVRALSHRVREILEEKIAEDRPKLVASLNKQLGKQEGKLKFSLTELFGPKRVVSGEW